jgi:tetratricopeptide (TPR) repeat protein
MKKISILFNLSLAAFALHAQSLEQGVQQIYYQRYHSAENTFTQLVKQDPNNSTAWYYLEKDYLLQDKLDKANQTIQSAPEKIKADPWYKVAYGNVLLQQGKKSEATSYFNDALKETKEKNADILSAVADAHINSQSGDINYAIELLDKAIKRDKKNPSLYVLKGDAYLKLANGSEAFKAYQEATKVNDKYAEAYHKLGKLFVSQKNPEMYVDYFQKAIAADPNYARSMYRLYVHEFNRHPAKAMEYYNNYLAKSDRSVENEYDLADLFFINKQFAKAIQKADALIQSEGEKVQPRLYKLISYSYADQKDSAKAFDYIEKYFTKEADSNKVSKDFLLRGDLYAALNENDSLAFVYYDKAVALEKDSSQLENYFKRFADLAAANKNYSEQAKWLGKYAATSDRATNIDLFNWGLAHYRAEEFVAADSAFGKYVAKYPEQSFGYYWQAKSRALQDKDLSQGLAIPAYQKLVEVLEKNPNDPNYKKWLVESYAYLAAYETNTEKDYAEAVGYFEKVLKVDPENTDAKKYIDLLAKNMDDKGSK